MRHAACRTIVRRPDQGTNAGIPEWILIRPARALAPRMGPAAAPGAARRPNGVTPGVANELRQFAIRRPGSGAARRAEPGALSVGSTRPPGAPLTLPRSACESSP